MPVRPVSAPAGTPQEALSCFSILHDAMRPFCFSIFRIQVLGPKFQQLPELVKKIEATGSRGGKLTGKEPSRHLARCQFGMQ